MTILGLAIPWKWVQPQGLDELVKRLEDAADLNVHERERENLCSCAAIAIRELRAKLTLCQMAHAELTRMLPMPPMPPGHSGGSLGIDAARKERKDG